MGYQGVSSEFRSIRQQTDFLSQSIADLLELRELHIVVSVEKVSAGDAQQTDRAVGWKGDGDDCRLEKAVESWLSDTVKLPQYGVLFAQHGVDGMDVVKAMTADALREMGICKVGHIIKFC